MKLYTYEESGNSYKVRLLLSFLNLPYESFDVDLMQDAQHQSAHLAVNPRGEVPALVDGAVELVDSMAILIYLASKYDNQRSWFPDTPESMAEVAQWLAFAASWVQYGVFSARAILSFGIAANGMPHDFQANVKEGQIRGQRSLDILDAHLRGRQWLALDRPTIGDIAVFPYVALAPMGDIPLTPYPAVEAWIERFKQLPGFMPIQGLDDPNYRKSA
jgi:glutathione S-transferase